MSSAAETAERLVTALEELAAQEAILVRDRDFDSLPSVQERAGAIARRLVTFASDPGTCHLRPRILAVVEQRQRGAALLGAELVKRQGPPQSSRPSRARTFAADVGASPGGVAVLRLRGVA